MFAKKMAETAAKNGASAFGRKLGGAAAGYLLYRVVKKPEPVKTWDVNVSLKSQTKPAPKYRP